MPSSKAERMENILRTLRSATPGILADAVVSRSDGLVIASAFPADEQGDRMAAMSSAMLKVGERATRELEVGSLGQMFLNGKNASLFLVEAGENAVLTALANKDAQPGLVLLRMRRAAAEIKKII